MSLARQKEWFTPDTLRLSVALVTLGLLLFIYRDGVAFMVNEWAREEYSYAYLLPLVVAFFIWQKKDAIAQRALTGSWLGLGVLVFALLLYGIGKVGTQYGVLQSYGLVVAVIGVALALLGRDGFRPIAIPLLMLFFLVPLPNFLYKPLSAALQLVSSELGVWVIHQFGISVHLDGNVIDLGVRKLQVVEACSGLRYLFPLVAIGAIVAYLYEGALWKRILLLVSSLPITVLMNSLRIAATGLAVHYWNAEVADDFMHFFEGWVVFMAALAFLVGEMWLLNQIGGERRPLLEAFRLDNPVPAAEGAVPGLSTLSRPFIAAFGLLTATAVAAVVLPERTEIRPGRADLVEFPLQLAEWRGRPLKIERDVLEALRVDDYLKADYIAGASGPVNLYIAYFGSQHRGAYMHSPNTCMPAGGWEILSLEQRAVPDVVVNGQPLWVNRAEIGKGAYRQLVYYWFQQRGRLMTNEYIMRWYLFQDAVTRRRTDGALVRLIAPVSPTESFVDADERLMELAKLVVPHLERFVPN